MNKFPDYNYLVNLVNYVNNFLGYNILDKNRSVKYLFTRYLLINYSLLRFRKHVYNDKTKGSSYISKVFNQTHANIINAEKAHKQLIKINDKKYLENKYIIDNIIKLYDKTLN